MSEGGASRSGRDAAARDGDAERAAEAVLAATRARSAALVARDAQALRGLHHPDFRFTTPRGDVRDRDQYIAGNTGGELVWRDQRLVEHEVLTHDDTAVLLAIVHDEFERAGVPGEHDMRLTLVWVKAGGEWVALAAHASPLATGGPAAPR